MLSTKVFCCALFVVSGFLSTNAAPRIIFEDMKDYGRIEIRLREDVCGAPSIKPDIGNSAQNIIGGKEAIPHSWPWQIELQRDGKFDCGGSILGRRWIVTAAHCLTYQGKPFDPEQIKVVVGQHDRTQPEPMKKTFQAKALHVHGEYNPKTFENDIGLIELESEISFNEYVQSVCLPTKDFKEGTMCATTGWGVDIWPPQSLQGKFRVRDPHFPDKLMEVAIPIFSQTECVKIYNSSSSGFRITDSMICAGLPEGGRGACFGDDGGPLVSQGADGVWQLVGVTFGVTCGISDYSGVFTRVQMFNEWIKNIID